MKYTPCFVSSDEDRIACYRVRYKVYVDEKGFEPPNESMLESDGFDEGALHIGIRYEGLIVGTVRIIFHGSIGEISRFCILPEHRCPESIRALIDALLFASTEKGLICWVAFMEPALFRLLVQYGVYFCPVGPIVEHRGWRQFGVYELN